jgi:divalent metal cation (Fe/Co/Zn/Cd) transporter
MVTTLPRPGGISAHEVGLLSSRDKQPFVEGPSLNGNPAISAPIGASHRMSLGAVFILTAGTQLGNPVLMTEAHVTLIVAYLAAAVLVGLALNALFGWWWADPLASLVIVYYGAREGWAAWHHEPD